MANYLIVSGYSGVVVSKDIALAGANQLQCRYIKCLTSLVIIRICCVQARNVVVDTVQIVEDERNVQQKAISQATGNVIMLCLAYIIIV